MEKITTKSWRTGTTANTIYYRNGRELFVSVEHKRNCGVGWFNSLPESEDGAEEEDITGNIPSWLDSIIDDDTEMV